MAAAFIAGFETPHEHARYSVGSTCIRGRHTQYYQLNQRVWIRNGYSPNAFLFDRSRAIDDNILLDLGTRTPGQIFTGIVLNGLLPVIVLFAQARVKDHSQSGWLEFPRRMGGGRPKHVRALLIAVVVGCIAPGLKTTNQRDGPGLSTSHSDIYITESDSFLLHPNPGRHG